MKFFLAKPLYILSRDDRQDMKAAKKINANRMAHAHFVKDG